MLRQFDNCLLDVSCPVRKAANMLYDNFKNATWVQAAEAELEKKTIRFRLS